ncbi:hypothetical protein ANN_06847 [Periplaneta americana]|uniref:Transposase Tc1-like domain-containing protein n=1 Tax=Periplaneta americana TaxID=6978 RepID=A0ABQ8TEL5_PERAM|nr:hypothetical protein ANN_06847 [Periplaneta americana]
MAGLCEGDNEPPGSLKASKHHTAEDIAHERHQDERRRLASDLPTACEQLPQNRQIAAECHIGLATVNSIIKRYRETGSITPQKKGNCGRKRKTSPADDRLIVRKSKLNPRLTAVDLTRELMATTGANIHVTTVRRRLLEAGRRARKIKPQPPPPPPQPPPPPPQPPPPPPPPQPPPPPPLIL